MAFFISFCNANLECSDDPSADRNLCNPAAESRSRSLPAGQHSHAEKLKALEWKMKKSFELSSAQPLAADAAESLRLKEIDYFHSSASCDQQENGFQNQDVAGNFDIT